MRLEILMVFWGELFKWTCGLQNNKGKGRGGAFSDCCGGDELVGIDGDSFIAYDYATWDI